MDIGNGNGTNCGIDYTPATVLAWTETLGSDTGRR